MPHFMSSFSGLALGACFLGSLTAAAFSDIRRYLIPNGVVALIGLTGVIGLIATAANWQMALWNLGASLAVLAVGIVLFAFRLWGAGDAKLLAAVSLWTGIYGLWQLLYWTALAGGVLAIALLVLRRLPSIQHFATQPRGLMVLSPNMGIPYGVAIAVGGIVAFFSGNTLFPIDLLPR